MRFMPKSRHRCGAGNVSSEPQISDFLSYFGPVTVLPVLYVRGGGSSTHVGQGWHTLRFQVLPCLVCYHMLANL